MSSHQKIKIIVDRFIELCQRTILDHVIAIALVGSSSRGDFILEKSDVDLLLVLKNESAGNRRVYEEVAKVCQEIDPVKKILKDVFIYTEDELSSPYLISTITYLWLYDAKVNGKVAYGNKDILKQIRIPQKIDHELCKKILLWFKVILENLSFYHPPSPDTHVKIVSSALLNYTTCLIALKSGKVLFKREQLAEMCKKLFSTDLIYQAIRNKHADQISKDEAERFHERAVSFVIQSSKEIKLV